MSTYVVGDIQGCLQSFKQLLTLIRFDSTKDHLWLAGDLINRGPESLETLRFIRQLGDSVKCVLGNHDLHLLAIYAGHRETGNKDTLKEILEAPDVEQLIDWLRQQPLMLHSEEHNAVVCHAGIYPGWDLETAKKEARAVEFHLRSQDFRDLFAFMYGNKPARWKENRGRKKRLRFAINCFTRMRYCSIDGKLDFTENRSPGSQTDGLVPWYELPSKLDSNTRVIFGHWSTVGVTSKANIIGIDTGCVWGGKLTAYELDNNRWHKVECPQAQKIG
ncbi:UNVERIFIED_CONTAM: hypothetical protein GTU68_006202 [Idotea baltica]|nr:hypothetical protein [Idotea baltica]